MPKTVNSPSPKAIPSTTSRRSSSRTSGPIPGEQAFVFIHSVPYECSVALVNLLTSTRLVRKGFDVKIVLYGPGVLLGSGSRGYPGVNQRPSPATWPSTTRSRPSSRKGRRSTPAGSPWAPSTASGRTTSFTGITPFNPLDVLDSALTAWRAGAFQINTWTV